MTTDSHTELIGWLRDRARESELGAGMNEDDEALAEDMLHDAAQWRAAADALESLSEQKEVSDERARRYDRFIRETIAVWDAKGPMIASDALRERFLAFTIAEAAYPASRQDGP